MCVAAGPSAGGPNMPPTRVSTAKNTSNSLADHAARIRQALGVTDDKSERRARVHNAAETCSQCGKCGRALTAEAPVWRARLPLGYGPFGRWQQRMAPVCADCASKWRRFRPPRPCENCGRPVHQEDNFRSHRRTFWTCERATRATTARQERLDARGTRPCEHCGETFEPTRTDARFCSFPCKQRAYRRRKGGVTDDECCDIAAFGSGNAAPLVAEGGRS